MSRRGGSLGTIDKQDLLEEMIDLQALAHEAERRGITEDPEFLLAYRNLLVGKLRQKELEPLLAKAEPGIEEISAYYADHIREEFTRPEKRRGAMIFVPIGEQAPDRRRVRRS